MIDSWIDLSLELLKFLLYSTFTFQFIVSTSEQIQALQYFGLVYVSVSQLRHDDRIYGRIKYISGVRLLLESIIFMFLPIYILYAFARYKYSSQRPYQEST